MMELFSDLSKLHNYAYTLLSQILIGCSLLSQECCKLIEWHLKTMRRQLFTLECPIETLFVEGKHGLLISAAICLPCCRILPVNLLSLIITLRGRWLSQSFCWEFSKGSVVSAALQAVKVCIHSYSVWRMKVELPNIPQTDKIRRFEWRQMQIFFRDIERALMIYFGESIKNILFSKLTQQHFIFFQEQVKFYLMFYKFTVILQKFNIWS